MYNYDKDKCYKTAKDKYGIKLDKGQDWSFFLNDQGEFDINKKCNRCTHKTGCFQSGKAILYCRRFKKLSK